MVDCVKCKKLGNNNKSQKMVFCINCQRFGYNKNYKPKKAECYAYPDVMNLKEIGSYRNNIDLLEMNDNHNCKFYKKKWWKIWVK